MENETKAIAATGTGGAVGVTGGVGAVAVLGTAGLGATGITSGLAAVGSIVGGGMAAGVGIVAVAPLACGALGYGLYRWLRN